MKKKVLKITGALLLLFVGVLVAVPFFLEAKIGDIIKKNVDQNVNATIEFSEAKLSLLKSFPSAEVSFEDLALINKTPFEGDTLFSAKHIRLTMGITQLFKGALDAIAIKDLSIDGALVNIQIDAAENANYDIALPSEPTESAAESTTDTGFTFDVKSYQISNSKMRYKDQSTNMTFELDNIQHTGAGDLSLATSELDTKTTALISFGMDSVNYLNKHKIVLDALIGIDLEKSTYSFLKNNALLNQLPLVFDGFVQLNDEDMEVNINFNTPSSDFKNFLGILPESYSKDIAKVKTTGNFMVNGNFKGIVDDIHIPTFTIEMKADNASFKYPDLPKTVKNVNLDVVIKNPTGITEDTFVAVNKVSFKIDEDRFNLTSNITDLTGNTKVKAHIDAIMHLANISKAYPVPSEYNLKGLLTTDITTSFDMASIEKEQYENTNTIGNLVLNDFEYNSDELANPIAFTTANLTFNPKTVTLNTLKGSTGNTDFNAKGTIKNMLGFMFNDEKVEGNFDLISNTFAIDDFMVTETTPETSKEGSEDKTPPTSQEKIKIPAFLDATINAQANKVIYDNIELQNLTGQMIIKDEAATLKNMKSNLFGGSIGFNGLVSTKAEEPTFAMKLNLDQLGIQETFASISLFKTLAPIAQILEGKLDTDISLSGNLTDDLLPNLLSLSGDLFTDVKTENINTEKAPLLSKLVSKLDFIDINKLDLKDLKASLSFEDGVVTVKPFTIDYEDITLRVTGSHTFDSQLNYTATADVPAKYLGKDITSLIAKIDDSSLENMTIPVKANIGGLYNSPTVTTDLTSGVKQVTNKLVEIQKQKLLAKGKDKAKDLIGGLLSGDKKDADTNTENTSTKEQAKEILGGLLGTNKKTQDTTSAKDTVPKTNKEAVKEKATNIIGGFLNKKKKDGSN